MADDNAQNTTTAAVADATKVSTGDVSPLLVNDAPMPDWLKKAQDLAKHEENAPIAIEPQTVVGEINPVPDLVQEPKSEQPVTNQEPISVPAEISSSSVLHEKETPLDLPKEKAITPAELVDAPLPPWLKKASEGAGVAVADKQAPAGVVENAVSDQPVSVENVSANLPVAEATVPLDGTTQQPESDKKDFFDSAKEGILSVLDKGKEAIEKAKTAGVVKSDDIYTDLSVAETGAAESAQQQGANQTSSPIVTTEVAAQSLTPDLVLGLTTDSIPESTPSATNEVVQSAEQTVPEVASVESPAVDLSAVAPVAATVGATPPVDEKKVDNKKIELVNKVQQAKAELEEQRKLLEGEKVYQQGLTTIRDLIAPSSMEIRYDMIRVEGMYAQSFFVYAYPRYLDTNWLAPIVNFDVTMDISQFIYPIDSATIMKILKKKVAQMQASVRINAEKGMVSDPALETALQDAEELRTEIQRGQEKLFQFALYFTIYSDDDKKIQKIAKQLESILGAKLILTKKAELQAEHGFNSTLPICLDELEVIRNMNTSPLSSTFPFSSSDLTSNEGILYGLNRHNDSLIIFDRFSLENANAVVFAKSGAGKSYAVKLEILRSMMLGTDVIVIDPEREYLDLCQTVGGSYLRVSLTSDRRINPFDLPAAMQDEELQPGDLLRSNIITLHGLLKIMLGGLTPEEEGILDKALNDVYSVKGITMDLVDPSNLPPPTMEDLYDILSTMDGGLSMAQRLQKYTSGTYSGIFNKPTNVDLGSGLIVFSIRDLEDSLRPIAMYIILNYIWNRVRSKLKKRLLVIDEAWWMMQHEDSARFLFGLVKRARKYYLGITTITQDVEDFVKSPYGKPVVTNSSIQLLLKQAPAAIDMLTKIFNLTEGEKYMLLNSGVGQGLFFAGAKHVAIQIIASYTEDKIVTTNPEEILKNKADEVQYE